MERPNSSKLSSDLYTHILWHAGTHTHAKINIKGFVIKNITNVAGEMAQQLRVLTALPEGLSSIPSNHTVAHNHL